MKRLYFCRHGLSQLGKAGLWAGSTDTPLAPEGREQAQAAGQAAKELHIDYVLSSPLLRAYDTAKIIARAVGYPVQDIEVSSLAVERDFGPLEGTSWDPDADINSIEGVEPVASLVERARLTLEHLRNIQADNILLVSHGSFGRALCHVIDPKTPFGTKDRFKNAEIVRLI